MTYRIGFELPGLPKTTNKTKGSSWWAVNAERKYWKDYVYHVLVHALPCKPLEKAKIRCVRYSSSAPDFDGLVSSFKPVIDGLTQCGVIIDDNMDVIGVPEFEWVSCKRGEGRIEVWVSS